MRKQKSKFVEKSNQMNTVNLNLYTDTRLCYVEKGDAYFTKLPLDKVWGDDWDDAPYECNAGLPYDYDFILHITEEYLREPCYWHYNSPYSVKAINSGAVAWLTDRENVSIKAGVSPQEFIELVHKAGDEVFLPLSNEQYNNVEPYIIPFIIPAIQGLIDADARLLKERGADYNGNPFFRGAYNGYLAIRKDIWDKAYKDADLYEDIPQPHGGITWDSYGETNCFADQAKFFIETEPVSIKNRMIIGFDTAHYGDTFMKWLKEDVIKETLRWKEEVLNDINQKLKENGNK